MKKKFVKGLILGSIVAFPLGINFGKDQPLVSNPFIAKPDFTDRMIERTNSLIADTKNAIHQATKPME